ncbi:hypothetical protein [Mesobacillus subterraneus]|uniref:hypothetical protein n=1 Tax=Mesobacillus subterraneus TaxID=285983 RepID=UPI001474350F|nr:hypothetical protein [Mesobacillus subterraneus]
MSHKGEFQSNGDQYKMPNALKQKKEFVYRVGYTASTGNQTNNQPEPGKRSDL